MGILAEAHVTLNPSSQSVVNRIQNGNLPNPTRPVRACAVRTQFVHYCVKTAAQTGKKVADHIRAIR